MIAYIIVVNGFVYYTSGDVPKDAIIVTGVSTRNQLVGIPPYNIREEMNK